MTHDIDAARSSISPLSDDQLTALVRDTADGWQMPPVQLDRPGWSDLVRRPRRRFSSAGGALRTGTRALVLGLALIVAAAAGGVILARLHSPDGVATLPSLPSKAVAASPSSAEAPSAHPIGLGSMGIDRLLVRLESGYAVVDLAKGKIGGALPVDSHGSLVRQLDDGSLVCICLSPTTAAGSAARYTVDWREMDSSGATLTSATLGTYSGTPDPRGQGPDTYENATIEISSVDSDSVYVGWSTRAHPTWHSGLLAVDVRSGEVRQQIALPDRDDGPDARPVVVTGPRVVGSAGPGRVLIDRAWYSDGPSMGAQESGYQQGFDAFLAPTSSGTVGEPLAFDGLGGCGNNATRAGSLLSGGWWAACFGDNGTTIRRFDPSDAALGDNRVPASGLDAFSLDSIAAVDATRGSAYAWNPLDRRLVKVDLASGEQTGDSTGGDLLASLGNWLAPAAEAKMFLTPSFTLSPDGTRGYALGTTVATGDESGTSTGVYLFDTTAMKLIDHWVGGADFQSIARSADGTTIYLASGATTGSSPQWPAITAVDAASGAARAIISDLGYQGFYFTGPQLP